MNLALKNALKYLVTLNDKCWGCGRKTYDGKHHVIPKSSIKSPYMNLKIPMCFACTKKLHINDYLMWKLQTGQIIADKEIHDKLKQLHSDWEEVLGKLIVLKEIPKEVKGK